MLLSVVFITKIVDGYCIVLPSGELHEIAEYKS